jgi:hypothetical protein
VKPFGKKEIVMKKMVLGISLTLAALVFLVSPAAAATPQQGAPALSVFLASLGTPAPTPVAKRPALGGKVLCSVSANCGSGGTIGCSGNNSTTSCSGTDQNCSVGQQGSVTCDGVTTWCPPCQVNCDDLWSQCELNCEPCPIKTFQCSSPYRCRCDYLHCG